MRFFIKSKIFRGVMAFLIGAVLILAIQKNAYFAMACGIGSVLFWISGFRLSRSLDKENNVQETVCKNTGFMLVPPTLGLIGEGVWLLFKYDVSLDGAYMIMGLSAMLSLGFLFQIVALRKQDGVAKRFMAWNAVASLSMPLSLIIVLLLQVTHADNGGELSAMTTILFGLAALLVAVHMIMVSACGYTSTRESIQIILDGLKQRKLMFTRASIFKDAVLVVGKSVLSIAGASFFMFVNALFSAGMGIARLIAVKMHSQEKEQQVKSYRHVGIILSISSICYVLYSVRLLFGGQTGVYDMHIALIIALYTFVEFGINIRESIRLRKSNALATKALRAISFSATLICFVLTQTAIMSFSAEGDNSISHALSGLFFGGLAAIQGLLVCIDSFRYKDESAESA